MVKTFELGRCGCGKKRPIHSPAPPPQPINPPTTTSK